MNYRLIIPIMLIGIFSSSLWAEDGNIACGYQVGGNSMVGISYEDRVSSTIGLHIGGGYAGAGAGVRIHFSNETLSPYLDLNWKDAGFGQIETIAAELGGTWKVLDESGIRGAIGAQGVVFITDSFKQTLVGNKPRPFLLLTLEIGWAWELQ